MKTVGYARVSTSMQGLSIEAQKAKIRAYCKTYDLTLDEIIVDDGKSGATLNRPGMTRLLNIVADGAVGDLVVTRLDRLTRSMRDLQTLLHDDLKEVELHSVIERVDTSTASGRLVLNVLMSVAEWEREAIGERTTAALKAKKARGEKVGRATAFATAGHDHDERYMRRVFLSSTTFAPDEEKQVTTLSERPDLITIAYNYIENGFPQATTYVRGASRTTSGYG